MTTHPLDYLIDTFGISRTEARRSTPKHRTRPNTLSPNQTTRTTTRTKGRTLVIPGDFRCVGRMKRLATLEQKVALFASELVCSAPGYSGPQLECEIHHMDPWLRGGLTNLINLPQQCFNHHPRNDETRSGVNGKGVMDRGSKSGRAGHYRADGSGPVFNDSAAHDESGGARARRKHQGHQPSPDPGPPDSTLGQPASSLPGQPPGQPPGSSGGPWTDDGGLF